MSPKTLIVLNDRDNVATSLSELNPGEMAEFTTGLQSSTVHVVEPIPYGHKVAIAPIAIGDQIVKYGEVIGLATQVIDRGQHVHVHNVESIRARGDK